MERPTVDLLSERSITVRLSKPGVADKPRANSGAYSVTTKKTRAGTEGGAVRVAAPTGCEILDLSEGQVMLRIGDAIVKISEADARSLADMLMRALP
jgi:hypothetical protein